MPNEIDTPPAGGSTPTPTPAPSEPIPGGVNRWRWANWTTKAVMTLAVLLLLGAVGTAGFFYKQLTDIKKDPNKVAADETNATISAIGKLIVLPTDEQPTLATVTDPSKLADQPFFASAKMGDKVLIYTNAKKAILYDPVANKIVEVAPINIGNTAAAPSAVSGASTDASKTSAPATQTPKK
ncbi:MAG: hypothetical protein WDN47_04220 [Candidatus Doudnabacteria bacterium]